MRANSCFSTLILQNSASTQDKGAAVEAMAADMAAITSRQATRWFCADCERWFDKAPAMCAAEGHGVTTARKTQYAFRCRRCARRAASFEKLLLAPCGNCGRADWEPCSVYAAAAKPGAERLDSQPAFLPTGEAVANSLRGGGDGFAHDLACTEDVAR